MNTNGAPITSYKLYLRKVAQGSQFIEIPAALSASTASYLLSGLVPGALYEAKVAGVNRVSEELNLFNGEAALKFSDLLSFETTEIPSPP